MNFKINNHFTVFEHETLRLKDNNLSPYQLKILQSFYDNNEIPYYSLIHNGVKFCKYVGVLQIGNLIIEILPKSDKNNDVTKWRNVLIGMLKSVGIFNVHAPSYSSLKLNKNSILDLYIEIFISEVEELIHHGLIKKYKKIEKNNKTLKGSLKFTKHITKNIIHKELFYTRYTIYDKEHLIHQILYKTIKLLTIINTNQILQSRLAVLSLNFPQMKDIKITEDIFRKIIYNKKNKSYKTSIEIAKLFLLNYHPNLNKGQNNVLALMFDMNLLWERFVYMSLKKYLPKGYRILAQPSKKFWKEKSGITINMRPDIVIIDEQDKKIVIDTKWKNIDGLTPSHEDLRQIYVYLNYFEAKKAALVYPGANDDNKKGNFFNEKSDIIDDKECSVHTIKVNPNIIEWQKHIKKNIFDWLAN